MPLARQQRIAGPDLQLIDWANSGKHGPKLQPVIHPAFSVRDVSYLSRLGRIGMTARQSAAVPALKLKHQRIRTCTRSLRGVDQEMEVRMKILKAAALTAAISVGSLGATGAMAANIVETPQSAGAFETLLAAAKAAGLAEALSTTEDISVFAPTDDAFAALPPGTIDDLLKPENKEQLVAILSMHVLPRTLTSNQLLDKPFHVRTLNSVERLTIAAKSSGVTVSGSNTANVVQADITADNGVIHVIDTVLLP